MNRISIIYFSLLPLCVASAFIFIADGLLVSSAGVLLDGFKASKEQIGLVNACFFAGAVACTIFSHRLISACGYERAFSVFCAIFALSALLGALSNNLLFWGVLRFFMGLAYYSIVMIIEVWLNASVTNSIRSRVLGIYETLFYASFGVGALFIAFSLSVEATLILSAVFIVLALLPLNLKALKTPLVPPKAKISLPNIFSAPKLALISDFIGGLCMNGFFSMASVFALLYGLGDGSVAVFIAISMVGGVCGHLLCGVVSDKFGRVNALLLASFLSLISAFLLGVPKIIFVAVFLLGAGIFVLYALSLAIANDAITDKREYILASRAMLFSYLLGSLFAAPILGFLMSAFGAWGFIGFYVFLSGLLLVITFFGRFVGKRAFKNTQKI